MALDAYDNLVLAEPGIFAYYPNDETTGTTADDKVGTADLTFGSGTTNPSTSWGTRITDILPAFTGHQALDFNGTNGHATYSSSSSQPPANTGMVIEGWIRMDSSQSTSPTIMGNSVMLVQQFNGRFYGKVGSAAAFGNYARTVGTVYHVMLAWSGGTSGTTNWSIYINGTLAGSGTVSTTTSNPTYTTIGGHWNGTLPFDGVVSRFAVYSGSGVYADASRLAASHYDAGVNGISAGGESHSGSGVLDGSGTVALSGTGYKGGVGSGVATGSLSATGTGSKTASGAGVLTGSLSGTGSGTKSVSGSGEVTATVTATGTGRKSASGSGAITETVTLTGTGGRGIEMKSGSGVLAASATLSGTGSKTGKGSGALTATVSITGEGFSNQIAPPALGMTRFTITNAGLRTLTWRDGTFTVNKGTVDVPTHLVPMVEENWVRAGILRL